jgi:magnesium transporter
MMKDIVVPFTLQAINPDDSVLNHIRRDYPALQKNMTIQNALAAIRLRGIGERIIYFYVLDEQEHLAGILPTRRLLMAEPDKKLSEIMINKVISIPDSATMMNVYDYFAVYKFLAFPVVDKNKRMTGIVDVSLFTKEIFDIAENRQSTTIFETIGVHVERLRNASVLKAFSIRFPWLLATIISGTICALLAGLYETTLSQALVLTFFLTLVLGLGESVSIQSMTLTLQFLRTSTPSMPGYIRAIRREAIIASLLGAACGIIVGLIAFLWRGQSLAALVIGLGIMLSLLCACLFGLSVPVLLHILRLDPKVSSGPIALALSDIFTLLCYFTTARLLL